MDMLVFLKRMKKFVRSRDVQFRLLCYTEITVHYQIQLLSR